MSQRILYNARNGEHLTRIDPDYLPAGSEGNECREICERYPLYRCTRDKGHKDDHAAHGWKLNGKGGRLIVMYARWREL